MIITVKTATFSDYKNNDITFNFEESTLISAWLSYTTSHSFNILASKSDNPEIAVYIKPLVKYENYEFEQLFGFSSHCKDYDPNKIVAIKYIKNYENNIIIL